MPTQARLLLAVALGALLLYALLVLALLASGRRADARALAGFLPDCAVLLKRLATDPRVPRRAKLALVLAGAYVAFPIDLVPDFIPVAGQLDDAIVVALALRTALKTVDPEVLTEHWPGPARSLAAILRFANAPQSPTSGDRER